MWLVVVMVNRFHYLFILCVAGVRCVARDLL